MTEDGNTVVGWGSLPYYSEFDSYGDLLYNARFPDGVNSYRAYLLPWNPGHSHGGHGPKYEPQYDPDHGHGRG